MSSSNVEQVSLVQGPPGITCQETFILRKAPPVEPKPKPKGLPPHLAALPPHLRFRSVATPEPKAPVDAPAPVKQVSYIEWAPGVFLKEIFILKKAPPTDPKPKPKGPALPPHLRVLPPHLRLRSVAKLEPKATPEPEAPVSAPVKQVSRVQGPPGITSRETFILRKAAPVKRTAKAGVRVA